MCSSDLVAIYRMPADIFPEIDIPVVSVIWNYSGVSPEEMAEVITIRSRVSSIRWSEEKGRSSRLHFVTIRTVWPIPTQRRKIGI